MPTSHDETANIIYKAAIYLGGVILGVLSKLAVISQDSNLKFKDFLIHGVIAMACAWLVWSLLSYYGRLEVANIASVIVGRYSDYIFRAVWKTIKSSFNQDKNKPTA